MSNKSSYDPFDGDAIHQIPNPREGVAVDPWVKYGLPVVEDDPALPQPNRDAALNIVREIIEGLDRHQDLSPHTIFQMCTQILNQLGDAIQCGAIRVDDMLDTEVWS